jgi:hypothetical protein
MFELSSGLARAFAPHTYLANLTLAALTGVVNAIDLLARQSFVVDTGLARPIW